MLDQRDLEQITKIVDYAIDSAIANLAETILKPSFDDIDRKFKIVDDRFESVDERFDAIEQQLDLHGQRFEAIETRLDHIESEMVTKDYLDEKLTDLRGEFKLKFRTA